MMLLRAPVSRHPSFPGSRVNPDSEYSGVMGVPETPCTPEAKPGLCAAAAKNASAPMLMTLSLPALPLPGQHKDRATQMHLEINTMVVDDPCYNSGSP